MSDLIDRLDHLLAEWKASIPNLKTEEALRDARIELFGKKDGKLSQILRNLGTVSADERPLVGKKANEVKENLEHLLDERIESFRKKGLEERLSQEWIDFSLPGEPFPDGRLHILTQTLRDVKDIFHGLGFQYVQGPEIETDYYNFEALNIAPDHPARDMWDSFYIEASEPEWKLASTPRASEMQAPEARHIGPQTLLRTHTSPVQIRMMEKNKPPLRVISGGKCFRRDAVDATHSFQFHQVEGFMVDLGVSFADLKGVLSTFAREIFGKSRKVRFVPSYFPFTEPSVEVLIDWGGKWLEILGAGMIHPFVLKTVKCPPQYTGFAFGLGIERIAMLKYGIDDIRLFYENDERFLRQF